MVAVGAVVVDRRGEHGVVANVLDAADVAALREVEHRDRQRVKHSPRLESADGQ